MYTTKESKEKIYTRNEIVSTDAVKEYIEKFDSHLIEQQTVLDLANYAQARY